MSPFFGPSEEYLNKFYNEIRAIGEAVEATNKLIPAEIAKATGELSKSLQEAYKAPAASRATPGGAVDNVSGWGTNVGSDAAARAALGRRSQTGSTAPSTVSKPPRHRSPEDENEREIDGGSQEGLPTGRAWQQRVLKEGIGDVLPLPRYPGAEPNVRDLLQYMATVSANLANKRQSTLDRKAATKQEGIRDKYIGRGKITAETQPEDYPDELKAELDQAKAPDPMLGRLSNVFSGIEGGYAQSRYIKGIISKVARPISNLSNEGFQTGMAQGGAPSGLFGLRAPWDPGFWAGVQHHMAQLKMSFGDNAVTPGQAATIMGNLTGEGWGNINSTQSQNMRTASQTMMRQNPAIASMPQYYEMMDKSTRLGAASLEHFNDTMKSVPDAMNAAHLSMQQIMSDMDQLGQQNKDMGGTYQAGTDNALAWNRITGLPASVMGALQQNPMVQGQTFMRTGLMPWEQGLASSGQHMQGIQGALDLVNRSLVTPGNIKTQIGNTGFFNQVSGQDQKEALMSHLLGVDKQTVHALLKNRHGMAVGSQIQDEADSYFKTIFNDFSQGRIKEGRHVLSGTGRGTWGQLSGDLATARDSEGHLIFSAHDRKWIENVPKRDPHATGGHWALKRAYTPRGPAMTEQWVPGTKHSLLGDAELAKERKLRIQEVMSKDTAKYGTTGSLSGPRLTIELGPAAKKAFHLQDPTKAYKASNNAGSADISNNPNAGGPTFPPTPNLDTAGGSGSSQYDAGNY